MALYLQALRSLLPQVPPLLANRKRRKSWDLTFLHQVDAIFPDFSTFSSHAFL